VYPTGSDKDWVKFRNDNQQHLLRIRALLPTARLLASGARRRARGRLRCRFTTDLSGLLAYGGRRRPRAAARRDAHTSHGHPMRCRVAVVVYA